MRFCKLYVENFGTLCGYSLEFSDGLTAILEDNGFGKSTLAAFIKAMFYGLPKTRKSNLNENERNKYTPWQGGSFGGTLDFEHNGKLYRIERFFLPSGAEDFKLYNLNTGKECNDFSENIGIELFGIDSDSFERSVYMKQQGPISSMTVGLSAKLTDLVENNNDLSNYDNAMSALKKRRLFFSTINGSRGAISDISAEISELEDKQSQALSAVTELDGISLSLKEKHQLISIKEQRSTEIKALIRAASSVALSIEVARQKDQLEAELNSVKQELSNLNLCYPNGLPEKEKISVLLNKEKELSRLSMSVDIQKNNNADREALYAVEQKLGDSTLDVAEITDAQQNLYKINELSIKANAISEQLGTDFGAGTKKSFLAVGLFATAALVSAILGVVVLLSHKTVGILLLAVAVILLGISGFTYLKNMIMSSKVSGINTKELSAQHNALTNEIASKNARLQSILALYPAFSGSPDDIISDVLSSLRDRQRLRQTVEKQDTEIAQLNLKISSLKAELDSEFRAIGIQNTLDYHDQIEKLLADRQQFEKLNTMPDVILKKLSELPKTEALPNADTVPENIEQLTYEDNAINGELNQLRFEVSRLEARKMTLIIKADTLPEIEAELENKRTIKVEYTQALNVIDTTIALLEKARDGLSGKYSEVMKSGFKKYIELLTGEDIGDTLIDTELNLNLERYGKQKDKEYFSEGYKDMFDVAMRLSLIDALYKQDKPPVILDDPFTNMDDKRIKNALSLLKKLANDRQILYFTCHSSRAI